LAAAGFAGISAYWVIQVGVPLLVFSIFSLVGGHDRVHLVSFLLRAEGTWTIWVKISDKLPKQTD